MHTPSRTMPRQAMQTCKDALTALSLVNLCFYGVWTNYFDSFYFRPYFSKDRYPGWNYLAIMLDVVLLAAAFWAATTLARRAKRQWALATVRTVFLLVLLVPFALVLQTRVMRRILPFLSQDFLVTELGEVAATLLLPVSALLFLFVLWRWNQAVTRTGQTIVLMVSPFVVFTFFQAASTFLQSPAPEVMQEKPLATPLAAPDPSSPRVVWMIFDEWDQRLTFTERHPTLKLPELDRLRRESLYATKAFSPGSDTLTSTASVVAGRRILSALPSGGADLLVRFSNEEPRLLLSRQPSIFSKARAAGVNAAAVGWFHPYCRLFADSMIDCSWEAFQLVGDETHLADRMQVQFILLLRTIPLVKDFFKSDPLGLDLFPTRAVRAAHRRKYEAALGRMKVLMADPAVGFVYAHWPIPHEPAIYDRRRGDFGPPAQRDEWYLDNLALVDRTVGELRHSLEHAGLWKTTTLILTSDHFLRDYTGLDESLHGQDSRVPFVLKLAGETDGVTYSRRFNTIHTHELVLALLGGDLRSLKEVAQWIDQHSDSGPPDAPVSQTTSPSVSSPASPTGGRELR